MKLTCVIVDDEYLAIKILQEYVSRVEYLTTIATFTQPQKAVDFLIHQHVDLLFLDIQMPQLNGIDLLKQVENPPLVIFTTARHDYALQAYDLDVLDYLVKPIPFDRFEKAVQKTIEYAAFKKQQEAKRDYIMIKADYHIHKILVHDIEFIEGLSEYVKIHTPVKTFIPLIALKKLMDQLPADQFVRIHKSYIIARAQVASFNHQTVYLKNGKTLPIGRSYKTDLLTQIGNE